MISLNIDGLLAGIENVKKAKAEVLESAARQYRSKILAMYREVLMVSPQFSGDFVSNWDLVTDSSPARGYQAWPEKLSHDWNFSAGPPHEAGDTGAPFMSAYMRGVQRMRYVKFGQPVYFTNATDLVIDSPQIRGPNSVEDLRDAGVITAWMSISSYLQDKYGGQA